MTNTGTNCPCEESGLLWGVMPQLQASSFAELRRADVVFLGVHNFVNEKL